MRLCDKIKVLYSVCSELVFVPNIFLLIHIWRNFVSFFCIWKTKLLNCKVIISVGITMDMYKLMVVHWSIFTLSIQLIYCASVYSSKFRFILSIRKTKFDTAFRTIIIVRKKYIETCSLRLDVFSTKNIV